MKFYGYRRADGSVGCRNLVAVIPSVVCAADVSQAIVQNVQGAVGLFHHQGCSQLPPDLKRVTDTLIGLALNPNVGAVLIVSLGCEGTDHARMYQEIQAAGKPVEIIGIQKLGGVSKAIAAGIDAGSRSGAEDFRPAAGRGRFVRSGAFHQVRCFRRDFRHGIKLCTGLCC